MRRLQQQFQALGCESLITLVADDNYEFDEVFKSIRQKINQFDKRFSRFLMDSELTKFNLKSGEKVRVSKEFKNYLQTSQQMSELTNHAYNPFVLPALQSVGYKGSWPTPNKLAGAPDFSRGKLASPDKLQIFTDSARIPSGSAIDSGGMGKGYLLDELSDYLRSKRLAGYWISLGGDIVCEGFDLNEQAWQISVQPASKDRQPVTPITNRSGKRLFVATSGTTKRRGVSSRGQWHHIIDPKTGLPARSDYLTVTVVSDNGAKADVLAKAILIDGAKQAEKFKNNNQLTSYVLQSASQIVEVNS